MRQATSEPWPPVTAAEIRSSATQGKNVFFTFVFMGLDRSRDGNAPTKPFESTPYFVGSDPSSTAKVASL